jgi:protein-S-isoprenylcysteine O-methyltransferase Ste14
MDLVAKAYGVLYWAWFASEVGILVVTRTRRGGGEVKDRGSLLLLWPAIGASVAAAMMYGETHRRTMLGGAPWLVGVALALMVAGLVVRWTAILTLGRRFSANVAIHATQTVEKGGLFRWVRHPSYSGMLLIFVSVGVYERSWVSLGIMVVVPTAALLYRIAVEERALTEAFGAEYVDYCRVTKRLVPGVY